MKEASLPIFRHAGIGVIAASILLLAFAGIVSLLSGAQGLRQQWFAYWPYITALATGFGVQVGLFAHLRHLISSAASRSVVAVSGATSAGAMISCCAHYLVNIVPLIGATGIVALIGQYQIQFFWVGLVFNAFGIAYIARKVVVFKKDNISQINP